MHVTLRGKPVCIVINAHIDPAGIGRQIINAVGGDLPQVRINDVMNQDFHRRPHAQACFAQPSGQRLILRLDQRQITPGCIKAKNPYCSRYICLTPYRFWT